ncbi:hypothetical protein METBISCDRAFT_17328 [Metschnikowia bicuspidata]|uniref:EF-hand n=1 Tax=Metschnikowia bicuspidata TaxID=27322 RepID=A0A4P9ZCC2_9ASCO|nr:hypothetical protein METBISCDRAFT_17328 [Metschnikowia bicuspidata]
MLLTQQAIPPTFKVGLTQEEKELYSQLFRSLDPERSGIVTGEKARLTFEKSGLPPNVLGEIWQLADSSKMGFLTQFGFCSAMRLIGYTQSGQYPTAQLAETPGPLPKFSGLAPVSQLVPQGTNNSLLQTQPSSAVSQANRGLPQEQITPVSPADYERFSQMFIRTTGSKSTPLDGNTAKGILTKAKLPTLTLGQIWSLVDVDNKGLLDLPAFLMAMHLIQGLLSGSLKQLPPFLPDHLWKSATVPDQPAPYFNPTSVTHQGTSNQEWIVSPLQKQLFNSIFDSLDTAKIGALGPDQVANFLKTSRLDQLDLATIWDLSDIENTGTFGRVEFSIALFLVNRRRAGMSLPNVVPNSLIASLQPLKTPKDTPVAALAPNRPATQPVAPPAPKTSAIDDLADIFGALGLSGAPLKSSPPIDARLPLQHRTSSSDLTYTRATPKQKSQLTTSFAPTSEFGKSLMTQQPAVSPPSFIGEDASAQVKASTNDTAIPETAAPPISSSAPQAPLVSRSKTVDYRALRNVPTPPKRLNSVIQSPGTPQPAAGGGYVPSHDLPRRSPKKENPDLLADAETAGKLSDANTDIANISNQVRSLTSQTSNIHEKKIRADQELARILKLKEDIDAKLKLLRTSYANEVKQVEQVESMLATAKEETEALRSEASIAEAKLNHLFGELNEKQLSVEKHQKINSALREKLGNANAEIAELNKQLELKASESLRLENEANVRKSQHQVALVKIDELKSSLAETDARNVQLQKEIEQAQHEEASAGARSKELEAAVVAAEQQKASLKAGAEEGKASASHGHSSAATAVARVASGALLGAVGGSFSESVHEPEIKNEVEAETEAFEPANNSDEPAVTAPAPPVTKIVDKVVEHPAQDMTGLDDIEARKNTEYEASPEYNQAEIDQASTNSYKPTEGGDTAETPVTSPDVSEYQFQSANVVGGMVGMPGVLVGVQRTDSLTSSVQNNPSMSVRDDNIDEVSDREVLDDVTLPTDKQGTKNAEGDRSSLGVGSFVLISPEEAKDPVADVPMHPLARSYKVSETSSKDDEFPPIKELDYDESSSEDDEGLSEKFDDAMAEVDQYKNKSMEFDEDFNDLAPAAEELADKVAVEDDLFRDGFDDLKIAADDIEDDIDPVEISINDKFTGFSDVFDQSKSFDSGDNRNDEWDELFAGFGNSAATTVPVATPANVSHDLAIEELMGMGFQREDVLQALETEHWNIEAATNYLLDHA